MRACFVVSEISGDFSRKAQLFYRVCNASVEGLTVGVFLKRQLFKKNLVVTMTGNVLRCVQPF